MKRFISVILVLCTIFSFSVSTFAAERRYVPLIPSFISLAGGGVNVIVEIPISSQEHKNFFDEFYQSPYLILLDQGTSTEYYPMSQNGSTSPEFVGEDKKWWVYFIKPNVQSKNEGLIFRYHDPLIYPDTEPHPMQVTLQGGSFDVCAFSYDYKNKTLSSGSLTSNSSLWFSYVIGSATLSSPSVLYPGFNMLKDRNFVTTKADMPDGIDRHYDWWVGKKNITNNVTPPVDPPVDPPIDPPVDPPVDPDPPSSSDPDYDNINPDKPYEPFDPDDNNSGYEPPPYDDPFDDYDPTENLPSVPNMPDFPDPPSELPDGGDDPFQPPTLPDGGDDPFQPPILPDGGDDPFQPPILPDGGDDPFQPPNLPDGGDDPFQPPSLPNGGDDPFQPPVSLPDVGYDPFQPPTSLPDGGDSPFSLRSWLNPFSAPSELPDVSYNPFEAPAELPDVGYDPFEKPTDFPDVVYDPFSIPAFWLKLFNL